MYIRVGASPEMWLSWKLRMWMPKRHWRNVSSYIIQINAAWTNGRFRELGKKDPVSILLLLSKVRIYYLDFLTCRGRLGGDISVSQTFQVVACERCEHGQLHLVENVRCGVVQVPRGALWQGWFSTCVKCSKSYVHDGGRMVILYTVGMGGGVTLDCRIAQPPIPQKVRANLPYIPVPTTVANNTVPCRNVVRHFKKFWFFQRVLTATEYGTILFPR